MSSDFIDRYLEQSIFLAILTVISIFYFSLTFIYNLALLMRDSPVKWAASGDHVTMTVTGVDMAHVR